MSGYSREYFRQTPGVRRDIRTKEQAIADQQAGNQRMLDYRWSIINDRYPDLSSEDRDLIDPLLLAGTSDEDIFKYISDLRAGHQDESKNSLSAQIAQQRANGLNPDLTGAGETQSTETPRFEPMPSQGGNGTNRGRAASFIGQLLQVASFGIDAYGTISGAIAKEGLQLAGVADADIASVVGDESGKVVDVPGFISQMVQQHGFSGKKAQQYSRYVSGRINAFPVALQRLKNQGDFQAAQSRLRLETYKNSEPFLADAQKAMKGAQDLLIATQELDLKEKKMKMEFLEKHPEYTEETLNAELAQKQEGVRKATADADLAEENVTGAQIDNAGKRLDNAGKQIQNAMDQERLTQMLDDNETRRKSNEVQSLQVDLQRLELEGIDKMLKFCQEFEASEDEFLSRPNPLGWRLNNHQAFLDEKGAKFHGMPRRVAEKIYKRYQKEIARRRHEKGDRMTISGKIGPVSASYSE